MTRKSWPAKLRETFFGERQGRRPKPFPEEILDFLQHPISFQVPKHRTIHVIIDAIQPIETDGELQLLLRFRIADHPAPLEHKPIIGDADEFQTFEKTHMGEGEDWDEPVFWYPLTSLNTVAQNKENLRSFVLANWDDAEPDDIKIAGDLTNRVDRLIED
jgi:hypothetical protein